MTTIGVGNKLKKICDAPDLRKVWLISGNIVQAMKVKTL